jgi:hypothetical protein
VNLNHQEATMATTTDTTTVQGKKFVDVPVDQITSIDSSEYCWEMTIGMRPGEFATMPAAMVIYKTGIDRAGHNEYGYAYVPTRALAPILFPDED